MSIEELEKLRKKARNYEVLIILTLSLLIILIGMYVVTGNLFILLGSIIFPIIIIPIIPAIFLFSSNYEKELKKYFISSCINDVFEQLNYEPYKGISNNYIDESMIKLYLGICVLYDYNSNDYISAIYKNIPFEASDLVISQKLGRHCETLFKGKWITIKLDKALDTNINVVEKGFAYSKSKQFFTSKEDKYKKIKSEIKNFDDKFDIYVQSENKVMDLLKPNFIDVIQTIANITVGKLMFSFINDKLHIAIHNYKDAFEPNVFKKIDEKKIKDKFLNEIKVITDIIDELMGYLN